MQKITPFLWFNDDAEEAMNFYVSLFKNSKVGSVTRLPNGSVMSASFELEGQQFHALNGGPHYQFTPAVSFFVDCQTQEEIDALWDKLADGGKALQCGWVTDRFGLTWQIVPSILGKYLGDSDRAKAGRVMNAMMKMIKIDIAGLEQAYEE